jgi:two-component system response regulator YesN
LIKIMLVDDEPMTRDGLKEFVGWSKLSMEVVAEASDGAEALIQYEKTHPDIVLCDVRMPRMDGLELATRLRESDHSCKIVFLSGYSDTPYLKKAIKLNAVDYVEKPVQIAELEELLAEIAEQIKAEREERQKTAEIRKIVERGKPDLTGGLVKRLLQLSSPSDPEWPAVKEELQMVHGGFPLEGAYVCSAFLCKEPGGWSVLREEAEQTAAGEGLAVLATEADGFGVALLAVESGHHLESVALWLNRLAGKRKSKESGGSFSFTAGVGEPCRHPGAVAASYRQALKALQLHFYRGWNTVIWHRELPSLNVKDSLQLFDKHGFIRFEEALRQKDIRTAIDLLDQAVNELLLFPRREIEQVRKKLFRWYVALTKYYPESMWEFEKDELWSSVFVSGELFTIRSFMMRRMEIIRENSELAGAASEKSVIRETVRFIQQHYNQDVSIAAIAEHVYLTPTYLCILFKKEKGISINDYITQLRIEKAKQLLADRKLRVYEISQMIGYQDANYFAKVFRKATGMNPSEYRETIGAELF